MSEGKEEHENEVFWKPLQYAIGATLGHLPIIAVIYFSATYLRAWPPLAIGLAGYFVVGVFAFMYDLHSHGPPGDLLLYSFLPVFLSYVSGIMLSEKVGDWIRRRREND